MNLPPGPFQLIYCDPPWSYRDKAAAGKRGASFKYPTLGVDDLAQIPVASIAAPDCLLAMWWVGPQPQEALDLVKAWGFELKTMKGFTWHKVTAKNGKSHFGMGNWTRCLKGDTKLYLQDSKGSVFTEQIQRLKFYNWQNLKVWSPSGWKVINDFVERPNTTVNKIETPVSDLVFSSNHTLVYKEPISRRVKGHKSKRKIEHVIKEGNYSDLKKSMRKSLVCKNSHSVNLLFSSSPIVSDCPLTNIQGFNLTEDLGWVLGLFCAEGNFGGSTQTQIRFSVHAKEVDFYTRTANYIASLALEGDRYKVEPVKVHSFNKDNRMSFYFSSTAFKELIDQFIQGKGAHEKRLNLKLLYNTPVEFRRCFLQGMLDGDGHLAEGGYQKLYLCNRNLILDFKSLCGSLGIPTTLHLDNKPQAAGNGTVCHSYGLRFYNQGRGNLIKVQGTDCFPITIKSTEDDLAVCTTYDICVEGELFVANDLVTHNSNTEDCLIAVRGKPKRASASVRQFIEAPIREHSQKPDEVRDRLVQLMGDVPRIELFSRVNTPGWISWGNEVGKLDH